MFTKWLKVGMSDMREWTEDFIILFFFICMFKIYDRVRKFLQL